MCVPPKPQKHFLKPHSVSLCVQLCIFLIFNRHELLFHFTGLQEPVFYLPEHTLAAETNPCAGPGAPEVVLVLVGQLPTWMRFPIPEGCREHPQDPSLRLPGPLHSMEGEARPRTMELPGHIHSSHVSCVGDTHLRGLPAASQRVPHGNGLWVQQRGSSWCSVVPAPDP